MSDETCAHENPAVQGMHCDKRPHPFGAHMNQAASTVWAGLAPPVRPQKGDKRGTRVKGVIDAIEASGNGTKTGPPKTGEELRNEAIRKVDANTPEAFRTEARAVLTQVAHGSVELTAEDVMDLLTTSTHDNRAMGAIMLWGVKEGLIAKTSPERFVQSRYPRRHKMDVRVWKSLVHGQ